MPSLSTTSISISIGNSDYFASEQESLLAELERLRSRRKTRQQKQALEIDLLQQKVDQTERRLQDAIQACFERGNVHHFANFVREANLDNVASSSYILTRQATLCRYVAHGYILENQLRMYVSWANQEFAVLQSVARNLEQSKTKMEMELMNSILKMNVETSRTQELSQQIVNKQSRIIEFLATDQRQLILLCMMNKKEQEQQKQQQQPKKEDSLSEAYYSKREEEEYDLIE
eukprot:CAMPEP_0118709254 /NCGR_PEP_ID=MMETSP0800-20121206/22498_1 /TAXON_ID=210618 ORGANISM="Striatella unipunctata, Strain CCMP2910" /NCGR_SAMPLE_ID=MMETSP0800 /ASSEMBLY_ACC=CAM_ASM_000638 /LENGTH=231 /DNA_ID=CAMNT_0006612853 /DNA_START=20 /DNA_END=716 /DNA_ORIENTATION=+